MAGGQQLHRPALLVVKFERVEIVVQRFEVFPETKKTLSEIEIPFQEINEDLIVSLFKFTLSLSFFYG